MIKRWNCKAAVSFTQPLPGKELIVIPTIAIKGNGQRSKVRRINKDVTSCKAGGAKAGNG